MTYLALARKWRPQRFDQIVGQPNVVQALTHALTQNRIHHAYLFTGSHGIGKTTLARLFAKCLNCETGVTAKPCETCSHCQEITAGHFPDLFEIDAASRTKVEDTRELLDNIPYAPTKGKFKIYLIDEVHMLSGHSFNALLKTLEEPPAHVKFLLATTDPQKLPPTVLSRCLQFHLLKMTTEQISSQLMHILQCENIQFESDALMLISTAANGSMRDALSFLDQCIAYGHGEIKTSETRTMLGLSNHADITALLAAIHAADAKTALALTKNWAERGVHFENCLSELLIQLYQLSVMQSLEKSPFPTMTSELKQLVKTIPQEAVQQYYQIALTGKRDLPLAPCAQIGFEMIVLRMIVLQPKNKVIMDNQSSKEAACDQADFNWYQIVNQLGLTGATLALAKNCVLNSLAHDMLQLALHSKYAALYNAAHEKRIQQAIVNYTKKNIILQIRIETHQMETPAEMEAKHNSEKTKAEKDAIISSTTVKRMITTFDAAVMD